MEELGVYGKRNHLIGFFPPLKTSIFFQRFDRTVVRLICRARGSSGVLNKEERGGSHGRNKAASFTGETEKRYGRRETGELEKESEREKES